MILGRLFSKKDKENHEEGRRLFEIGMECATRYKCDDAIDFYTRSIEASKNPAPYINRANILGKRIRHFEALADLKEAKRLDLAQGNEFFKVIQRELSQTELLSHYYENGMREKLIADYSDDRREYIAERILCVSFDIKSVVWEYKSFDRPLIEFHLFNEIDSISKFDNLAGYPDASYLLDLYSKEFIAHKISKCPDEEKYRNAEIKLHCFLCSYPEEHMRRLRNYMIYDIHKKLLDLDFDDFSQGLLTETEGVIKEAQDFQS